jgi:hypothetical protein
MAGVTQLCFQIVEEINNLKIQLCYDGHIYIYIYIHLISNSIGSHNGDDATKDSEQVIIPTQTPLPNGTILARDKYDAIKGI